MPSTRKGEALGIAARTMPTMRVALISSSVTSPALRSRNHSGLGVEPIDHEPPLTAIGVAPGAGLGFSPAGARLVCTNSRVVRAAAPSAAPAVRRRSVSRWFLGPRRRLGSSTAFANPVILTGAPASDP